MTEWTCGICNTEMTTELSCRVHISENHWGIESLQKSFLDHSIAWINTQSCPFCGERPAKNKRQFISHVGRHLQDVSHAAIPPSAFQGDSIGVGQDTEDEALSDGEQRGSLDIGPTSLMEAVERSERPQSTLPDEQTYTTGELEYA